MSAAAEPPRSTSWEQGPGLALLEQQARNGGVCL